MGHYRKATSQPPASARPEAPVAGSVTLGGTLSPLPTITVAGRTPRLYTSDLPCSGEFLFNVRLPDALPQGDQTIQSDLRWRQLRGAAAIEQVNRDEVLEAALRVQAIDEKKEEGDTD